ncbi:hypothetical protein [Nocardioides zhouii]|uniref:Type IV toxin-antitoxin system AbiEi family antitoxin domain-containing protein n=1 Tax=Nocardioides zhouii TaxID=1168729 RepID=A0A4Q2SNS9_9ACTN|nr:hypothetical protein [Nocardioides zhouii]RYC05874.1 hypothetical protein EUA94_16600 [Nocardioides zhouii]
MDLKAYADLLALQSGVVSRRQLLEDARLEAYDIQRLVRRRDLVRVYDGVFVNHTGDLTWLQRAWVGVHLVWPAALAGDSALRAADGPGRSTRDDSVVHLAVDRDRHARVPTGYRLHRMSGFDDRVRWNTSPPRVRIEEALIDVAVRKADDFGAIAVLSDAIQARRTRAERIREALDARARVPRRDFLAGVLRDLERGTCSVLEHGYLTRVEQPHGLPTASRQVRDSRHGPLYRDVLYAPFDQVVELDGRMWHDSAEQHDADLDRDLDAAVERLATVRLGWGQVYGRPCETAVRIGRLLSARGWLGQPSRCPDCPDSAALAG